MSSAERTKASEVIIFDQGSQYDEYLKEQGHEYSMSSRTLGIQDNRGVLRVVIDRSYYLQGGITQEQFPALVIHEEIEQSSTADDPHLEATVGEYKHILDNFEVEGLEQYHANLCNLIGGSNDVRKEALRVVLENI